MSLSLSPDFSRVSVLGSKVFGLVRSALGKKTVYFDGVAIDCDNENLFRSCAFSHAERRHFDMWLRADAACEAPRWCIYRADLTGRGGRVIGSVSIMGRRNDDGGNLASVAGLLKEIRAEAVALDLTASDLSDQYALDMRGFLFVFRDACGALV